MRCPREGCELEPVDFLGVTMDACAYCDGTWLDAGELASIHKHTSDLLDDSAPGATDVAGPISCPRCAVAMTTSYFSSARRIVVDRCPTCGGIWLDREELKGIVTEAYKAKQ